MNVINDLELIIDTLEKAYEAIKEQASRIAKLEAALRSSKNLITVMRMPNIEHVADAHNAAVETLRAALEKHHE